MKYLKSSSKLKRPKLVCIRRVVGDSMLPTLVPNQVVVGIRRFGKVIPGKIYICSIDELEVIKRVGYLSKDNQAYLLGDNTRSSRDSRQYGLVAIDKLIFRVLWPL